MKTAVSSVIFDGAIEFFEDFIQSLSRQTTQNFSLILINDNISKEKLKDVVSQIPKALCQRTHIIDKQGQELSIADLRVEMIKAAYELDYDLLIMMDCDDMASEDRVESICQEYDSEYAFFYNELRDFAGRNCMPKLPQYTFDYKDIGQYNYLGMSNGSLNLRRLTIDFIDSLKNGKTNVFDWYLYSRLLLRGEKGKKVTRGFTLYRIYEDNFAGKCNYNQEAIEKEIAIKKVHFSLLSEYSDYYRMLMDLYETNQVDETNVREDGFWWSLTKGRTS